ncbi:MAG: sodium/glutamate symporter, partial [Desulfobacterales bacterium]|nr:sodium/glutamate symporter [Desulfobacterales bacterium]
MTKGGQGFLAAVKCGDAVTHAAQHLDGQIDLQGLIIHEKNTCAALPGGLLFSVLFGIIFAVSGTAVEFHLEARDVLLVYFFTTIGINASLKDLRAGGKPLAILLVITIGYMIVQNLTGVSVAALFGEP